MENSLRILFVTSEIDPFLKVSTAADMIRLLPQKLQERGHEIRILMPKFGVINDRRNRLHEVVRLSGINIKVGKEEKPLTIKVASIPNAKLQVYFLDNEDYFQRKSVLTDPKNNKFHEDNDERAIFFCKGAIETVKKLGWAPDIIHCHGWMSTFIPLYLRTHYKDDPMFKSTKVVFTLYNDSFDSKLHKDFLTKTNIDTTAGETLKKNYNENSYVGVCSGGIELSDYVTKGTAKINSQLEKLLESTKHKEIILDVNDSDSYVNDYQDVYSAILN